MKLETRHNSKSNQAKIWCGSCEKYLFNEDYGLEVFAPGIIDLMESRAIQHQQKTNHSSLIMIFNRKPTLAEIRKGK